MMNPIQHCQRPWWKRPPVWFLAVILLGALGYVVAREAAGPAPMPYGVFLDQLEAGNVASATFDGTEIDGRFKHPLSDGAPTGTSQRDSYRSRVPDFGDPELIPELRKEHVAIDVRSPSQWASLLARLPWPMLVFVALILIVALVRIVRGPKASSGPAMPLRPGAGIIGLVSSLFGKSGQVEDQPPEKRPGKD
jgi:hypothetical protein